MNITRMELNSIINNQKKINDNLEFIIKNIINKKSQIDENNIDMEESNISKINIKQIENFANLNNNLNNEKNPFIEALEK